MIPLSTFLYICYVSKKLIFEKCTCVCVCVCVCTGYSDKEQILQVAGCLLIEVEKHRTQGKKLTQESKWAASTCEQERSSLRLTIVPL
jgi:hypothetical protein